MMGDFNAKIGSDSKDYEEVIGQQNLGEINDTGERFADLCATINLVTGRSFFHNKWIHKATWVSPNLLTEYITMCVLGRDSEDLRKMCAYGEEPMLPQVIY